MSKYVQVKTLSAAVLLQIASVLAAQQSLMAFPGFPEVTTTTPEEKALFERELDRREIDFECHQTWYLNCFVNTDTRPVTPMMKNLFREILQKRNAEFQKLRSQDVNVQAQPMDHQQSQKRSRKFNKMTHQKDVMSVTSAM